MAILRVGDRAWLLLTRLAIMGIDHEVQLVLSWRKRGLGFMWLVFMRYDNVGHGLRDLRLKFAVIWVGDNVVLAMDLV